MMQFNRLPFIIFSLLRTITFSFPFQKTPLSIKTTRTRNGKRVDFDTLQHQQQQQSPDRKMNHNRYDHGLHMNKNKEQEKFSSDEKVVDFGTSVGKDADLPLSLLFERTLDTFEDIMTILRRTPLENLLKNNNQSSFEDQNVDYFDQLGLDRKTVVILGSGWAAHAIMKVADCTKLRLVVISPTNHFVFTPMLASAAVGTVEYRSMTEAVRSANPLIHQYIEGKAVDVNVKDKFVSVKLNSFLEAYRAGEAPIIQVPYDHLVVSVGCQIGYRGVPGAKENTLRLKSCEDARKLRIAIGECFEYASRPDVAGRDQVKERSRRVTFLIVGGGPTGVELAGEIADLTKDITRKNKGFYPKLGNDVKIILVQGGPSLVPQFEDDLRVEALNSLKKKGIEIVLNTKIISVEDGSVTMSRKIMDETTGEVKVIEEQVLVGLTVWCAGTAPVPFVDSLLQQLPESARNKDGRINVDGWMRPPMKDPSLVGSIFVLGDAAAYSTTFNTFLPQTAQVAGQQGAYTARLLSRGYNVTTTPPSLPNDKFKEDPLSTVWLKVRGLSEAQTFAFLNLGLLAYIGGGEALTQVQIGDVPVFAYAGSVAFILWRSVYLVKQVATRNRILVTFDWVKSALFGRDMTRL